MATLANLSDVARQYRERNVYLDPYRFPNEPQTIVSSQIPPCNVCFPRREVGPQLPALCECGDKSTQVALQYSHRVVPDPQEQPPNDDYIKSLPRNLAELYQSVPSCNPPPVDKTGLPVNFTYKPPKEMFMPLRMTPVLSYDYARYADDWQPKDHDHVHVTGRQGPAMWPKCRCNQPLYFTFESRVRPVRQFGTPVNGRSEALSRVGAGEPIPRPPLPQCRAEDSINKFPMDRQLTPIDVNRGMPERLIDFPPKAARLNRWRHT